MDERIQKTRSAVKTADLATGLTTLLAGALGLLLLAAIADHWLVAGGFDRWGRFALFVVGLLGAALYIATRLGPALLGRVNPLYAAQQIEQESPGLKNSLLNLLQLRSRSTAGPAAAVQQTLERQAAERLAAVGDTPIDQGGLVRMARVVMILVAAIGLYVVASPKDFFASAGRVLAPWADIAAPSRVQIAALEPGDAEVEQGARLEINASVEGLREDELVEIVYSTADGRVVNRHVPMHTVGETGVRHTLTLPAGEGASAALGLQGDLIYRLEAGDARTRSYRVGVLRAPTIAPVSVTYQYPEYTGYSPRTVEGVGDLRAIEGTRVSITAAANLPIDSAQIDLGADGRPDVRMQVDDKQATGSLRLRLAEGESSGSATSYVLRFTSTDNQANHSPPQYRVEVVADLPPEAAIISPEEPTIDVTVAERVRIEVEARDPDFALKSVRLIGESAGRRVLEEPLSTKAVRGRFTGEKFLAPRDLGLRPGEVLEYWVEATDTKAPQPNQTRSEPKRLRVIGPADDRQNDPDGGPSQPGAGGKPQQGDANNDAQPGQSGKQGRQEGGRPDQSSGESGQESNDPGGASERPDQQPQGEDGEQNNEQGEGRKPSPGGLRAPGEGGGSGEPEGEPNAGSGGESGEESGQESGSPAGSGFDAGERNDRSGGSNQRDGERGAGGENREPAERESTGGDQSGDGEQQGGADTPAPRDGEDDATAFERIREFLENQQKDSRRESGESSEGRKGPSQNGKDRTPQSNNRESGESSSDTDPTDARDADPDSRRPAGEGQRRQASDQGQQKPREGDPGQQPDRPEDGPGAGEQDRGGKPSDSATSESGDESPPGEPSKPNAGPREGTGSSGQNQAADQGAGQSADQGAGDSSGHAGDQQRGEGPTGESGGQGQSDGGRSADGGQEPGGESSEGGAERADPNSGDPSGGAEQGDPSGSPRSGQDEPGAESGADQQAGESGRGGEDPSGKPGEPSQQDGKTPSNQSGDGAQGKNGQNKGSKNGTDRRSGNERAGEGAEPGGDDANLDYAREQTELVLEQLEEQLRDREVDRKLLEKLGWTEQDLRRFVDRWQSRRQKAQQRGPEGQAELDRALKSLGLSPDGAQSTRRLTEERLQSLRDRARQKVPARLRAATDRYNRSLNALSSEPSNNNAAAESDN